MNPENIKEVISKARPNIKESTIKMYIGNLNKLKKIFEVDDFKFLKSLIKSLKKLMINISQHRGTIIIL